MSKALTVNMKALGKWIESNEPQAIEKLAIGARVSTKTAQRVMEGLVPGQPGTRWRVSLATGIPEDVLFPKVSVSRKTA